LADSSLDASTFDNINEGIVVECQGIGATRGAARALPHPRAAASGVVPRRVRPNPMASHPDGIE
jgi:hypothetical protein